MAGYVGPIEKLTLGNDYFRQVLFTGKYAQLVVMCLQPGEEIGNEVHPNVDQFFRIEQGEAAFVLGGNEKHLAKDGDAVIVFFATKIHKGTQRNASDNRRKKK